MYSTTNTHNHLNLTIIWYKFCSICKCPPINCEIRCQKEGLKGDINKREGLFVLLMGSKTLSILFYSL